MGWGCSGVVPLHLPQLVGGLVAEGSAEPLAEGSSGVSVSVGLGSSGVSDVVGSGSSVEGGLARASSQMAWTSEMTATRRCLLVYRARHP